MAETVEVVHYRDPDASCQIRVFVDGAENEERKAAPEARGAAFGERVPILRGSLG